MKLILIVSLLLYSCCPKEPQPKVTMGELEQFSDIENGVICYRVFGYNGLSCVQTKLIGK